MVAIVSGSSLGLSLGSMASLGGRGSWGSAAPGRAGEGVYVNAASGNLVLQRQDESVMGRGLDIAAVRTYNSQGRLNDDNGDNWSMGGYSQQLRLVGTRNTAGSSLVRTDRDGAEATYLFDAGRALYASTAGAGAYDTLSYDSAKSQYVWSDGDSGVQERYDAASLRLVSSKDPSGNTLTYAYNPAGLIASVSDGGNEQTFFDYAGNNLSQVRTVYQSGSAQTLTRARYAYDTSNRLNSVTVDLTPADNAVDDSRVYVTRYAYDGASRRVASIAQGDGTSLAFTYVQVGADYRVASIQDGLGRLTQLSYDTVNRRTSVTDPLGYVSRFDYDAAGQLVQVSAPAVDGQVQTTRFAYSAGGDVTQIVDGLGRAVDMSYDGNGNLVLQRDAAGNTVTRTFDLRNQLLTETTFAIADRDGAGPAPPGQGLTSCYVYDSAGKNLLRYVLSPGGRVSENVYDSYGQRIASIGYSAAGYPTGALGATVPSEAQMSAWAATQDRTRNVRTDYAYDFRGQLTKATSYANVDAAGAGIADTGRSITQYVYDQAGLLLKTISGLGGTTVYTYDGLGRRLGSTDALSQATLTQYDDAGGRISVALANGLVSTSIYDRAGRLVAMQDGDSGANVLATRRHAYDADGRLRMTTDATGVRQWMLYDQRGRKVADIDGNGSLVEYSYDEADRLTRSIAYATALTDAAMAGLTDVSGNPAEVALTAIRPQASANDRISWLAYDEAGRLERSVDPSGAVTAMVYDGASRLLGSTAYAGRVSVSALGFGAVAPSADDRVSRHFYDADGLLLGVLDGEGYLSENQYDAAGRLVITVHYANATAAGLRAGGSFDQLRPATSAADQIQGSIYNGKGQVVGSVDAEGYLSEKTYDADGNLTRLVRYATRVGGPVTASSTLASLRPAASPDDQVSAWAYDKLDRVTTETNAESTQTRYVYDSIGRLVSTARAWGQSEVRTSTSRFDLQGRLVGELSAEGSALLTGSQTQAQIDALWLQYGLSYSYDAAGRRLSAVDQNGNKSLFYYDVDGRLTQSIDALGEVAERSYDALGQLSGTRRYATRLGTALLASLTGGLQDGAFLGTLAALRNDALDSRELYTYSAAGQLATSTDALDAITRRTYDAFGDLVEQASPLGGGETRTDRTYYDRRGLATSAVADVGGLDLSTLAVYDGFGRLVRSVDGNGNCAVQSFDRLGRVVQTVDRANGLRSSTYDSFDRVLTQTDANQQTTRYAYGTSARSLTVTTPEGVVVTTVHNRFGQTLSIKDGRANITSYTYDRNGNLKTSKTLLTTTKQDYDRADRLIQATDARGIVTTYTYDAANRLLTRQLDPGGASTGLALTTQYGWSAKGEQVSVTDARGIVTTTRYDRKSRQLEQIVDPGGLALRTCWTYDARDGVLTVTSPTGALTRYAYDKLGRRSSERIDPDGLNITRSYRYDRNGNVVGMIDGNQQVTRYTYDAMDRLVWSVDGAGDAERNDYDAEGRLARSTRYAQALGLDGLPPQVSSAQLSARAAASPGRDAVTARRYDKDGRLRFVVDGTGAVQEMKLDGNGNAVERIAYANRIDLSTWNGLADPVPAADASRDRRTRTVYDALDRATYLADALGTVTQNSYDLGGNLTRQNVHAVAVASDMSPDKVVANASDRITVYTYDAAGRESGRTDAFGAVTLSQYDADGNLRVSTRFATLVGAGAAPTSVKASSADRVTTRLFDKANRQTYVADPLGSVTRVTYDAAGRVATSTRHATAIGSGAAPDSVAASIEDRTDRYEYDAAGRLKTSTDALGGSESYSYDGLGNKLSFTNKKGSVWNYAYDAAGRLTTETSPQVRIGATFVNVNGDLIADEPAGTSARIVTQLSYDGLGNLSARTEAAGRAEQRITRYAYDAVGRQIKITYPPVAVYNETLAALAGNGLAGPASRAESALQALGTSTLYDALGNAVANIDVAGAVSLKAYDAMGRVSYEVDGLGYVTGYQRNAFGESTAVTRYAKATALTASAPATDAAAATAALIGAAVAPPGLEHGKDRLLLTAYDKLGRAALVTEPVVFAYDATARQSGSAGKTTTSSRNAFGELVQTSIGHTANAALPTIAVNTFFYYDKAGNQIGSVDALGYLTEKTFDAVGNLTRITEYAKALAARSWTSAAHAAATADAADRTTFYAYDAGNRKTQESRSGASYSSGGAGNDVAAPRLTRFGYDALGNLTSTVDALDGATYSYYDALGRVTAVAAPSRPGAQGAAKVTPLTLFQRDAYGNVVAKIERAAGAASAVEFKGVSAPGSAGFVDGPALSGDRSTLSTYDALGHATQVTDPDLASRRMSYDARGQLAKSWQMVSDGSGARTTLYQAMQYDRIGQLTHSYTPGPTGSSVTDTGLEYNGFGELVRKGLGGNGQEFFDFDNAGQLWRSNAGDGITKVFLYDTLGRQTSDIRNAGGAYDRLAALKTPDQAAALTDTRRTDTQYDALGRAIAQLLPQRLSTQGGLRVSRQVNDGHAETSPIERIRPGVIQESDTVDGPRSAAVTLNWSPLDKLGPGDVKIEVWASGVAQHYASRVVSAQDGIDHAYFNMAETDTSTADWVVDRFVVSKRDVEGAWKIVVDCSGDAGAEGNDIDVAAPSDPHTGLTLEYRATGTTAWKALKGINFGDTVRYNADVLKAGMFDYRVQTVPQGQAPRISSTGTLSYTDAPLLDLDVSIAYSASVPGRLTWKGDWSSTDTFRYRLLGSTGAWSSTAVSALAPDSSVYASTASLAAGTYEFELLRSRAGNTSSAYAHATGTLMVAAGVAAVTTPAVGYPNVTGFGIGNKVVGTKTINGLYWDKYSSGTPTLSYRLAGATAWGTLAVMTTGAVSWAAVAGLPAGNYEFSLAYKSLGGTTVAAGAGTFTLSAEVAGHYETRTVTVQVPVSITPPDPAAFITGYARAAYGPPVVLGYADDEPVLGAHYAWSGATVVGLPYQTRDIIGWELLSPDERLPTYDLLNPELTPVYGPWYATYAEDPGHFLIAPPRPIYGAPIMTLDDGGGEVLSPHYMWLGNQVVGVPYVALQDQQQSQTVWVAGTTPAPTLSAPPLPYTPAGTIAAIPKQYTARTTTVAGSVSISGMTSQYAALTPTVTGDGSLSTIVYPLSFAATTSSVLSWQAQGAGIQQAFRYRVAGSGAEWSSLGVSSAGTGKQGVNAAGLDAGAYEYELLWTRSGESSPFAHALGSITLADGAPASEVPAVGSPNLTGIGLGAKVVGTATISGLYWNQAIDAEGRALQGTPRLRVRIANAADWTALPVSGLLDTGYADIAQLAAGNYEFSITYEQGGATVAAGTGTLRIDTSNASGASLVGYANSQVPIYGDVTMPPPPDPTSAITGYSSTTYGVIAYRASSASGWLAYPGEGNPAGGSGDDFIAVGSSGSTTATGGAGNDWIFAGNSPSTLDGGAGDDVLKNQGAANATILFGRGDGRDVIAWAPSYLPGRVNTLQLKAGVLPADVVLRLVPTLDLGFQSGLEVSIRGTSDKIVVVGFFPSSDSNSDYNTIQQMKFADGTVWSFADMAARVQAPSVPAQTIVGTYVADSLTGGAGDDYVIGFQGNDSLYGGAGDDFISGGDGDDELSGGLGDDILTPGAGNNIITFARGDGHETVFAGSSAHSNTLRFAAGVAPADIRVTRVSTAFGGYMKSLQLAIAGAGDTVTLEAFFSNDDPYGPYAPIQKVQFSDGTEWTVATLLARLDVTTANGKGTVQLATVGTVALAGGAGGDVLYANSGDVLLQGLGGDDSLLGGSGNDTLDGGVGNDLLMGGGGNNTYVFGRGDGQDTIVVGGASGTGTIQFRPGVTPGDLLVRRTSAGFGGLLISIKGTTDQISVNGYPSPINAIRFADGTLWDMAAISANVDTSPRPQYGPSVVLSTDAGNQTLAPGYVWAGNAVIATSYVATGIVGYVQTPVYGDFTITTATYRPGEADPGTARQYSSSVYGGDDKVNVRPVVNSKVDRWGNVIEASDVRNVAWKTLYRYNDANQVISETRPTSTGLQTGNAALNPSTETYYDALGRQVAVKDTLGHVNAQAWDAGGNLVKELHADNGKITYAYDALGNKTAMTDALGNATEATDAIKAEHTTAYQYDRSGRLLATVHGAVNVYSLLGDANMTLSAASRVNIVETSTYDEGGRLIGQTDGGGHVTRYQLDRAGHVTQTVRTGMATTYAAFDAYGHQSSTTDALGKLATWETDYFGRVRVHTDVGGHRLDYDYDSAGQLTERRSVGAGLGAISASQSQTVAYRYDAAGQLLSVEDKLLQQTTTYAYDLAGRHVLERTVQAGVTYQDNHLGYDALGRLRDVNDGRVHAGMDYDAAGNRTHVTTRVNIGSLTTTAAPGSPPAVPGPFVPDPADDIRSGDRWFRYDAMNRQTVVDAVDAAGNVGQQGHQIEYDKNGNRSKDTWWGNRVVANSSAAISTTYDQESGNVTYVEGPSLTWERLDGQTSEVYTYDALDRLKSTERDGIQVDLRFYDGAGNAVQTGRNAKLPDGYAAALNVGVPADGAIGLEKRKNVFDAAGRLKQQRAYESASDDKRADIYYEYDGAGNVASYRLNSHGRSDFDNTYTYGMVYGEGYLQKTITGHERDKKLQNGTTTNEYDQNGYLVKLTDDKEAKNNRSFVNDLAGHALAVTQNANMTQRQLVVNGEVLGRYGMGIDPVNPRNDASQPVFSKVADFNFGYQPINGNYPTASPGSYTVRAGDTLAGIARGAYGDQQLWYRIAEVNNLSGDGDLRVGQTLTIPNKVGTVHNSADTFKPYDPSKITGDTTPNMPAPAQGKGCGGLGLILVIIVAIVVTIFTAGLAAAALAPATATVAAGGATLASASALTAGAAVLGGSAVGVGVGTTIAAAAIGAAAGSVVSQGLGIAIGVQDKFSWKQVALAAIGGGISGGLTAYAATGGALSSLAGNVVVKAAVTNALTQGIGVATGLQNKFDWRGVAASAAGAWVGAAVGGSVAKAIQGVDLSEFSKGLITGTLSGLAAGTASAALHGGRISVERVATDAFGNALGQGIVDVAQSTPDPRYSLAGSGARLGDPRSSIRLGGSGVSMEEPGLALSRDVEDRLQTGQTFSDVYGPVASFEPTADALSIRKGTFNGEYVKPDGTRVVVFGEGTDPTSATGVVGRGVPPSSVGRSIERSLKAIEDLAQAYRESGMTGATGDVAPSLYLGADGRLYDTPQPPIEIVGKRMTQEEMAREYMESLAGGRNEPSFVQEVTEKLRAFERGSDSIESDLRARAANGPSLKPWDPVAQARAANERQRTANNIVAGAGFPFVSTPMFAARAAGMDEYKVEQAGIAGMSMMDFGGLKGSAVATRLSSVSRARLVGRPPSPLLQSEGKVGTYEELIAAGVKGDNVTPHHIPSAQHMEQYGVSRAEGIAINMEMPSPGVGGRHRRTFTYGSRADVDMSARDALAAGVWDARSIYRQDGFYDAYIRQQLQEVVRQSKAVHPDVFKKP